MKWKTRSATMNEIESVSDAYPSYTTQSVEIVTADTTSPVVILAEAVLVLLILGGNTMVIIAFAKNKQLQTFSNFFLVQLAVADLMVGLTMCFYVSCQLRPSLLDDLKTCALRNCCITFCLEVSLCSLVAMTYDRFESIFRPFHYHQRNTRLVHAAIVVLVWTFSFSGGFILPAFWHNSWEDMPQPICDFLYIMKWEFAAYVMLPLSYINILAILVLNIPIIAITRRHLRAINTTIITVKPVNPDKATAPKPAMHMLKTGIIVTQLFLICWTPVIILVTVQLYGDGTDDDMMINFRFYLFCVSAMNSFLNPIVYAIRLKPFREEFKTIFGWIRSKVFWCGKLDKTKKGRPTN